MASRGALRIGMVVDLPSPIGNIRSVVKRVDVANSFVVVKPINKTIMGKLGFPTHDMMTAHPAVLLPVTLPRNEFGVLI